MPMLRKGENEIEYFVDGKGPALILVHGTGGNAETNWSSLTPQLARRRTIVRPNYSGSGATLDDEEPLTIEKLGDEVIAVADALDLATFDLVGFSLGAAVTTYVAARYPSRLRKLVLIAGFSSSEDSRLHLQFELWKRLIDIDKRAAADLILLTGFSPEWLSNRTYDELVETSEAIVAGNNWDGMRRQVELNLTVDTRAYIHKIVSPTLIIGCTHDHMVSPSHSRELERLLVSGQYRELSSGHLAPLETPDALVQLMLAFLDS